MTVEALSKGQALLQMLPEIAAKANVPVSVLRVSIVAKAGAENAFFVCVDGGRTKLQERKFKRAVEAIAGDEAFAGRPEIRVKGHHNCAAHYTG